MKKVLILLLTFLSISAFVTNADDVAQAKVPLSLGPREKLNRSLVQVPLECYYYSVVSSICSSCYSDLGDVTLTVTNTSTGEVWYDVFDSGTDPQTVLPISGTDGLYEIVYATEAGDVYEGSFTVE